MSKPPDSQLLLAEALYDAYNRHFAFPGTTAWKDLPARSITRVRWLSVAAEASRQESKQPTEEPT